MNEGKFEDLLNREVDGETTDRETTEFEEYLAKNPQANAYREDLENLASMFQQVRDVDPPADLKDEILAQVRQAPAPTVHKATLDIDEDDGWFAALSETVRGWVRPLELRSPYAFAAGMAVSALAFFIFADSFTSWFRVEESIAPGAIVSAEELAVYESLDAQSLTLDGVHGQIGTKIYGDRLLVELRLESQVPVQVSVTSVNGQMVPVAFRQVDPGQGRVEFSEAEVAITHQGTNEYYFVLRRDAVGGSPLAVRTQAGVQTSEFTLKTR